MHCDANWGDAEWNSFSPVPYGLPNRADVVDYALVAMFIGADVHGCTCESRLC